MMRVLVQHVCDVSSRSPFVYHNTPSIERFKGTVGNYELLLVPELSLTCSDGHRLRPPRCVSTGPVVVRLAGMANERAERERERDARLGPVPVRRVPSEMTSFAAGDAAPDSFAGDAPEASLAADAELEASVAQIFESLRVLDDHTEALEAYDAAAEDEPDWLMQATAAVKHISAVPVSPAVPPALGERQVTWDEKAATVQFEITSAGGTPNMDVGALAWIDAQLVPIVARSFPHLARLVISPDNDADTAEDYARELLKKRDALLLRKRQVREEVVQRSAVGTVAAELRKEEYEAHLLRVATVKQASGRHESVTRPYRVTRPYHLGPRPSNSHSHL